MADRNIPRAEAIFANKGLGVSNVYKNKKAPAPPSGELPKIGNYKPKSLAMDIDITDIQDYKGKADTASHNVPAGERSPKPFIIGDKDTPLDIDQTEVDTMPIPPPRRKRKAPSVPDQPLENAQISPNPLYGRSVSNNSDDRSVDDLEEQGGEIDFGLEPDFAYDQRSNDWSNVSVAGTIEADYDDPVADIDFGAGSDDEPISMRPRNTRKSPESDLPYIPPPDYDDEEMTFNFDGEERQVFKEYVGEDFGKYLTEDEDNRLRQRRRGPGGPPPRVSHGQQRRPLNPQPKKYKKKKKGAYEAEKRNTLRDFTFSDTKIGWGDRTVKSTSAKGRYIKREKERNKMDTKTHFNNPQTKGPSYEDFLLGKRDLESPNSSDSGVDTGEASLRRNSTGANTQKGELNKGYIPTDSHSDIFYYSQPKQMRNNYNNRDHKASLWKRLTWRFKKSVNIS